MHNLVYLVHFLISICSATAVTWLDRRGLLNIGGRGHPGASFLAPGLLLAAASVMIVVGVKASSPPEFAWDFIHAYYPAGVDAIQNDHDKLRALIGQGTGGGFVNIPIVAYLFAPLGLLSPAAAAVLFSAMGLGLTAAAWLLLCRLAQLDLRERWTLGLLFVVNGPLLNSFKYGNLSYFILFALVGGLALMHAKRSVAAGLLLGVATVIKPPLALFGFLFLFRRDVRGLAAYGAVGVSTILLSLLVFGLDDNLLWFQSCIVQYSKGWLPTFSVQSVTAFILRLNPDANLTEWVTQLPTAGQKLAEQVVVGVIFLIALAACVRRPGAPDDLPETASRRLTLQFLMVICLCLVTSPLAWSHYYAWLLVPTAFFIGANNLFGHSRATRLVGWAAIALVTPLNGWPSTFSDPLIQTAYRSVFMSHALIGGLLWFGLVALALAVGSGKLTLPAAARFARPKT